MISREIFNQIIEKHKEGKTDKQISIELNINKQLVISWIRKGKYDCLLKHNYDFSLFETLTNKQFGEKYKIARGTVSDLRKKYAPHTNSIEINKINKKLSNTNIKKSKEIDDKILQYILDQNKHKIEISIKNFLKENNLKLSYKKINKERFENIAKQNGIDKLMFMNDHYYEHGIYCERKSCHCDIYRLARAMKDYFYVRKIKVKTCVLDCLANDYLSEYKEDCSKGRKNFYEKIFGALKAMGIETRDTRMNRKSGTQVQVP